MTLSNSMHTHSTVRRRPTETVVGDAEADVDGANRRSRHVMLHDVTRSRPVTTCAKSLPTRGIPLLTLTALGAREYTLFAHAKRMNQITDPEIQVETAPSMLLVGYMATENAGE